jgi:mannose-6-phosphate isomerase-like protein (cupin superfamily)
MDPKFTKITEDGRGAIFLVEGLLEDNKEFTFMEMKKGSARGGCFHPNDEHFAVIKGKVRFILGDEEKIVSVGDAGKIPAMKSHAFIALEDSIVSEWGITTEEKKANTKDKKLRAYLDETNKKNNLL